ncbi:hypothetical protein AAU61_05140 [Desulfocarbo indianensis]|nr:hypothetical protein AAU61_05140 [Desulfocarbo indianensis]
MNLAGSWDDILVYLANPLSRELARARLERISGSWPSDLAQLKHAISLASQGNLQELMLMHLLARVLLAGQKAPKWLRTWLRDNETINVFLSELTLPRALKLRWEAVPVPIVKIDGEGGVFMMLVAPLEGSPGISMPYWSRETLEKDCLEAISQAFSATCNLGLPALKHTGFYCWPLLDPGGPPVQGRSLGLPLSIALGLLAQKSGWPKALMATGSMDDSGKVLPVGGVMAKSRVAAEAGTQLFLYPDEEKIDFTEWPLPALPVSDLRQAMTFAQLVAIGLPAVSNFRLYYSCLQNPALLLDNFNNIPASVLEWAKDRGVLEKIKSTCGSTEGFAGLVTRLGDSSLPRKHRELLASVLREEDLESLAVRSSQDALMVSNWYSYLLSLADDLQNSDASQQLKSKAKKLFRDFGNKIYVFYRTEDHRACYRRFDEDLGNCLVSLEDGPLKAMVSNIWRKQGIYLHLPITRGDDVSVRVFLSEKNQVVALSLNAVNLDVNPEDGKADFIENCLHALYLGLIRAAFVINQERLMGQAQLHEALCRYFRAVIDSVLSREIVFSQTSRDSMMTACDYYYASCFMGLEPPEALAWSSQEAGRHGGRQSELAGKTLLTAPKDHRPLRWLSQLVFSLGITCDSDWLWQRLATSLSRETRYSLGGALDHFMGLCVLSSYGTGLFENELPADALASSRIEDILLPYLMTMEYATERGSDTAS